MNVSLLENPPLISLTFLQQSGHVTVDLKLFHILPLLIRLRSKSLSQPTSCLIKLLQGPRLPVPSFHQYQPIFGSQNVPASWLLFLILSQDVVSLFACIGRLLPSSSSHLYLLIHSSLKREQEALLKNASLAAQINLCCFPL